MFDFIPHYEFFYYVGFFVCCVLASAVLGFLACLVVELVKSIWNTIFFLKWTRAVIRKHGRPDGPRLWAPVIWASAWWEMATFESGSVIYTRQGEWRSWNNYSVYDKVTPKDLLDSEEDELSEPFGWEKI